MIGLAVGLWVAVGLDWLLPAQAQVGPPPVAMIAMVLKGGNLDKGYWAPIPSDAGGYVICSKEKEP